MKHFLMRILVVLCFVGLAGIGWFTHPQKAAAAEANPIVIGVSMDFSGSTAQEGIQEFPGFEMAVKEKNAAGGVNGRQIKLFTLDNGGDPTKTVGTLKVLKDVNKAPVVYYGINSVGGIAAKAWADQNKVPIISPAPISDKLIQEQGKAWFFRTESTNTEVIKALMIQAKRMGAKKIGLQITTQAFGSDLETEARKYLPQFGLEIVGVVKCEPDSKDLTIQATRLRATNPDLVVHQNYPADQVVFARALKTIGWNPPSIGPGLIINICLGLSPVELYEGWIAESIWDRDKPSAKAVWDKYEAYTKKRIETDLSLRGYDTAQILFEILRLSGNPDNSEAIRDAFYKIKDFPVITGRQGAVCNFEIGKNYVHTADNYVFNVVKAGKMTPWVAK